MKLLLEEQKFEKLLSSNTKSSQRYKNDDIQSIDGLITQTYITEPDRLEITKFE